MHYGTQPREGSQRRDLFERAQMPKGQWLHQTRAGRSLDTSTPIAPPGRRAAAIACPTAPARPPAPQASPVSPPPSPPSPPPPPPTRRMDCLLSCACVGLCTRVGLVSKRWRLLCDWLASSRSRLSTAHSLPVCVRDSTLMRRASSTSSTTSCATARCPPIFS